VPIRPSLLLLLASLERVMGDRAIGGWLAAGGWATPALVGLASVAYLDQERLGIGGGS
jgi:hypothetical protein